MTQPALPQLSHFYNLSTIKSMNVCALTVNSVVYVVTHKPKSSSRLPLTISIKQIGDLPPLVLSTRPQNAVVDHPLRDRMAHCVDPGFRIPVLHPTLRIVLTPPNIADGRDVVAALNDPRVYMNLNGPPYPYTDEDYWGWYEVVEEAARTSSEEMQTIKRSSKITQDAEQNAGGCQTRWAGRSWWVSAIRELRSERSDTGEETKFLGEITVRRSNFLYILDEAERQNKVYENNSLEAGDPKILWEVGFYLIPECHGRGIMPMVLQTLISEILIPYFNLQRLEGTYFEHNVPSRKVFEKCGFEFLTMVPDAITLAPAKTGRLEDVKVGMGVMTWQRQPTI